MYNVKIIADSIAVSPLHSAIRSRLTTIQATFPRFILAEWNTHRRMSRNSASSRAIPVRTRIAQVWNNPFVPEAFGRNKSGMQASANLGGWQAALARWLWILASRICVIIAWSLSKIDVHKQHANRLLELWAWHTVVASATEWENFFNQRCSKYAQPEMEIIARKIWLAMQESKPRELKEGEWHLPYITEEDRALPHRQQLELSVVKCAAVSYERQDAERTPQQVTARYTDMRSKAHWSPFEHQAFVFSGVTPASNFDRPWMQHRKQFPGEAIFRSEEE